ncbi:MAG: NUDIX hydrolase [Pseudomonadota bacterium]|nr:NUDIX hydrolase [Pseudomonadota bacterium]
MTATPAALSVVLRDGHVLLVRRRNPPDAGLWGYPGGKVDPGETPEQAAVRELAEETGVVARAGRVLDIIEVQAEGFHYAMHAVACTYVAGEPMAADDVSDAAWVPCDDAAGGRLKMSDRVVEVLGLARQATN